MEYFNNKICVTVDDIKAIVKEKTFFCWVNRKKITCERRAFGQGVYALYSYDSLPDRVKKLYVEKYGDPREALAKVEREKNPRVVIDTFARTFYENYRYESNGVELSLTNDLIERYTANASVMNALLKKRASIISYAAKLNCRPQNLWGRILDEAEDIRADFEHTLPATESWYRRNLLQYKEVGYAHLISGKLGSSNTRKITKEAGELLVALKRSKDPVYNNSQILAEYNRRAEELGFKQLKSQKSVVEFLYSPAIEPLWHDAVLGERSANQKFGRKNKTELPTMRDSLWYGDGTKLNIYYRDDKGEIRTTMVYEVIDAYSEKLLGYGIGDTEGYAVQYAAYRMAIMTSKQRPYEVVHDNQGGHNKIADLLNAISRVHRSTMPYRPQAKTIESVFGRFQSQVLHQSPFFSGQNITARREESRANIEWLKANKDSIPTYREVVRMYEEFRDQWNNGLHHATGISRNEMYATSVNPELTPITIEEMVDAFWVTNDRQNTFTSAGLDLTVNEKKYTYEVYTEEGMPDMKFRSLYTNQRFTVKYDPCDLRSIRLYKREKNGALRFVAVADPYLTIKRGVQEQQEGDRAIINTLQGLELDARINRSARGRVIDKKFGLDKKYNPVGILGTAKSKDVEGEVTRRANRILLESAGVQKIISNMDWSETEKRPEDLRKTINSKY